VRHGDFLANDVAFYSVEVSYPSAVTLIVPGRIIREASSEGRSETTFTLGPARDLYMAAARDWQKVEETREGITVEVYAPAGADGSAREAMEAAYRALHSFGKRWGKYPFARLVFASVPFSAYGLEFPGAIVLSRRLFDPSFTDRGIDAATLLEATVAHEVAHQWFYGIVGNDQLQEPWLDEAMAQYGTVLYYQDRYGKGADGFLRSLEDRWDRVQKADLAIDLPVAGYTADQYGAIIYGRAPLFLRALSERIGETAFDGLMAEYCRRFYWKIATTADFASLAEQACGYSLDDLYAQWGLQEERTSLDSAPAVR
jgi:aminopeptidase N